MAGNAEQVAVWLGVITPILGLITLVLARTGDRHGNLHLRHLWFYAGLVFVGGCTVYSILAESGSWIASGGALAMMFVGGTYTLPVEESPY